MVNTNVNFKEQKNGYDKDQVDNYINRLTEAYQRTYDEYLKICSKYNDLTEDYKNLEEEKQIDINSAVISKVLMDTEKLAQEIVDTAYKIIATAYNEEARIIDKAKKNFEQANEKIEQAMSEAKKFLTICTNKELGGTVNEMQSAT